MKPIFRVFTYLKYFPLQIVLNVFFNILHIIFNLGSYVLIVPFVQLMFGMSEVSDVEPEFAFNQHQLADWAFWHLEQYKSSLGMWRCLLIVGAGYLACSFLSNLFRYLGMVFLAAIRNGLVERLRNDIYHKVTVLPVSFFSGSRRGDLISRMANDLFDIEWSVFSTMQSLVKDPINVIVFSATLLFVSWRLFVLFLIVLPVGVWMIAKIGKGLKRTSQRGQSVLGSLFAYLDETISNIRTVKLFGREARMMEQFEKLNGEYKTTMIGVAKRKELSSPLSEVLGTLALVFILIIGGWQVIDGYILPSIFIFFVLIFARLIPPIQAMVRAYNNLLKGSASAARFLEILDADEVIVQDSDAVQIEEFNDSIELCNVGFAYKEGEKVLRDINLSIKKGQMIALVGRSGAGKSTLADLLPRFYDVTTGRVEFDGVDIKRLDINSLRSKFGIVAQDCILFNDTIANNISFGSNHYSQAEIESAAKVAYAHQFIEELPDGYNTIVGDRGVTLSGGQRQRISIARAVLRNPPCLILDEATSALDSEAEAEVQRGLSALMKGRTTVVIAHRLSTIRHADMIVVVDDGRIVERGTHEQLIDLNGIYKKMVDSQSFTQ
ncbi:MAG: ABC transporter ATP-binding protein [Bacteroidales bacterium]|nr:ABC transporter ATP-binding protein [Bacteroidales bacterium]MBR1799826.1 ABC transporter ATP-binding protein [Bacteroidales bacterium]